MTSPVSPRCRVKTRKQLIDRCRALNVRLSDDGSCVRMDAPKKFVFKGTGLHFIDLYYDDGWKKGEVYASLFDDLDMGLEECGNPECEGCAETFTEENMQSLFPGEVLVHFQK